MNVAEGCGRDGDREFARFLHFAMGSANELEYQLLLSRDLGLIDPETHSQLESQASEVKKMLTSLLRKLRAVS
jgi:four helix bundle protein